MTGTEQLFNYPVKYIENGEPALDIKCKDGIKYLTTAQVNLLRRTVKAKGDLAMARGNKGGVRDWMLVDLLSSTGVRASEAANIRIEDINIGYSQCSIFIRCGKGRCSRTVYISSALRKHLKQFIKWKERQGEPTGEEDYLFMGQKGHWTRQAVSNIVKKYLKALGIYKRGMAAHTLRHTYGMLLYRQEHDLRAIQKQLGHSSVSTTQIYADVIGEDILRQVNQLWNYYE